MKSALSAAMACLIAVTVVTEKSALSKPYEDYQGLNMNGFLCPMKPHHR
jgi:hypothetical protein